VVYNNEKQKAPECGSKMSTISEEHPHILVG